MAKIKLGDPFGMDQTVLNSIDWEQAARRVATDMRSDFIFAPHTRIIFNHNPQGVIDSLKSKLRSGSYLPGSPLTIEVPKSSRIKVQAKPPRPGPNYSRPGSILFPEDRLFYQVLADMSADIIDNKTDRARSFSHEFDKENPDKFFSQTRVCWSRFQSALKNYSSLENVKYVLKVDIANFFGSVNQHSLVNNLLSSGVAGTFVDRLEAVLTSFTNVRSSRGIIQGVFPSDMFGNFYLEPFDRFMADLDIQSARYVDDIYIFLDSVASADRLVKELIPQLRQLDLTLNEAKSSLFPKSALVVEEPDLEELFQTAIEEIRLQLEDRDFDVAYGFQSEWGEDEEEGEEIELKATMALFDAIGDYRGHEEEIERFCLPLFIKAGSDYAVEHVLSAFKERPSMCQIYCTYLARFVGEERVFNHLVSQLSLDSLYDWQLMWVIGALLQGESATEDTIRKVVRVFRDAQRHDAVRAVAAIYIGAKGDNVRRTQLISECVNVGPHVQSAIYFVSQRWPSVERSNMRAQWGNRLEVNALIGTACDNWKKSNNP